MAWKSLISHRQEEQEQELQIPQHENQLREIDQLLQQKEIKIQQTEQQRQEQVNQLQETLCEVRRELQQQISKNSVLIEQQAQSRRVTKRDITLWLRNIIYKGIPKENVPQRVANQILKDNMNLLVWFGSRPIGDGASNVVLVTQHKWDYMWQK